MYKKAQAFKILNMSIWRLVFLTVLFFTIHQFAYAKIKTTVDVSDLKASNLENIVLYSGAISYVDYETGRVHPETIDFTKFSNVNGFEDDINYTNSNIAALFELRNLKTNDVATQYFNKKWYDRWEPLSNFKGYKKVIRWRYVLIDTGAKIEPGVLRIEMVIVGE